MKSLIGSRDYFGDPSAGRTNVLDVVAFRFAKDLACLQ